VSKRKHESDCDGLLIFLHQLASHIIDGRDVIRIYGMPQAKTISEKCRAEQHRIMAKGNYGPEPGSYVEGQQDAINTQDSSSDAAGSIVE
jgi:hypothetical protein